VSGCSPLPSFRATPYHLCLIFLSYSRQNVSAAADLSAALERRGYDVWRDTSDIRGGSAWREAISDAIASAQGVVVLLSPQATDSESVARELSLADEMGKLILPVVIGECEVTLGRLAYTLSGVQIIDGLSRPMSEIVVDIEAALPATGTQQTSTAHQALPRTAPPPLTTAPRATASTNAPPVDVVAALRRRYRLAFLVLAAVVVAAGTVAALALRSGDEGSTSTFAEVPVVTTAPAPQTTTTVIPEPTTTVGVESTTTIASVSTATVVPPSTTIAAPAPTPPPAAIVTLVPAPRPVTTGPHGAAIASRCVRSNLTDGYAAVREAPGVTNLEVGRIPSSTCEVEVYANGSDGRISWLQVGYGDIFGWSAESNFS
jgi:TIR domain